MKKKTFENIKSIHENLDQAINDLVIETLEQCNTYQDAIDHIKDLKLKLPFYLSDHIIKMATVKIEHRALNKKAE